MSYTTQPKLDYGDDYTATMWDTYVKANFAAGIPDIFTAEGDIAAATGAKAAGILAAGSDTQVIEADSGEAIGIKNSWSFVPVGGIIMWNSSLVGLPSNWQICDGTNGTPDLRDQFIVGAGSSYNPDNTGGQDSIDIQHNHSSPLATGAGGSHSHSQADTNAGSSHTHTFQTDGNSTIEVNTGSGIDSRDVHQHDITTDSESSHIHNNQDVDAATHSHDITIDNQLSTSQDIRPPFYAIYFIMRLS